MFLLLISPVLAICLIRIARGMDFSLVNQSIDGISLRLIYYKMQLAFFLVVRCIAIAFISVWDGLFVWINAYFCAVPV